LLPQSKKQQKQNEKTVILRNKQESSDLKFSKITYFAIFDIEKKIKIK